MSFIQVNNDYINSDIFCKNIHHMSIKEHLGGTIVTCYLLKNFDSVYGENDDNKFMLFDSQTFKSKKEAEKWLNTYLIPKVEKGMGIKELEELLERIESLEESLKFMAGGKEYQDAQRDFLNQVDELPHKTPKKNE